jgi:Ala-tRNA(Pro) deacylase
MTCRGQLERYLRMEGVPFGVHSHPPAFTAQAVVEHEHIPAQLMAKVVVVVADGELVMLVLPTSRRVDLALVSALLDAREVRLATEAELAAAFPDCEPGAMPPFGNLYGLPVYVDRTLAADQVIFFQVGTHTLAFSIAYADFSRLVAPGVAEFSHTRQRAAPLSGDTVRETGGW